MGDTLIPFSQSEYAKSNKLITAKYKSTLLENQIMAISLTRIEKVYENGVPKLQARIYPGEIKRLISDPKHISRDLDKISSTMMKHVIYMESGPGEFQKHSLVTDAEFKNGVFTVWFHEKMEKHITELSSNYTRLELGVVASLSKNATFRLYELLKKDVYRINEKEKPYVEVQYNLAELRFILGLVNSDDPAVLHAIDGKKVKDWDAIYESVSNKNKQYVVWADLKRYVLDPAQKEIEEIGNLRFEYEVIKRNRSVHDIIFRIFKNNPKNLITQGEFAISEKQEKDSAKYRQMEFPYDTYKDLYDEYTGHNGLTMDDISYLLKVAKTDVDKVKSAIALADKTPHIENHMGWLIACIQGNYSSVETLNGSAENAKRVRKVVEDYESTKEDTAMRVWEKCKSKSDFDEFLRDLLDYGLVLEKFDAIYEAEEKTDIYFEWKKSGVIAL